MKVFTTTLVKKDGKLDFNNDAVKKVYKRSEEHTSELQSH